MTAQTGIIQRGRFRARLAAGLDEVAQSLRLRGRIFRRKRAPSADLQSDRDDYDAHCNHVLIHDDADGRLVASCRFLVLQGGAELGRSYAAQYYDLTRLYPTRTPILELGRLCVRSDVRDPDILRCVLAFLTEVVDQKGVGLMIGCTSFSGTDPTPYADAFALLAQRHLSPKAHQPLQRACEILDYPARFSFQPDVIAAHRAMPSLLRSYLAMGGWVSDHAVVDRDLDTLHLFTCVDVDLIPPARIQVLRGLRG